MRINYDLSESLRELSENLRDEGKWRLSEVARGVLVGVDGCR